MNRLRLSFLVLSLILSFTAGSTTTSERCNYYSDDQCVKDLEYLLDAFGFAVLIERIADGAQRSSETVLAELAADREAEWRSALEQGFSRDRLVEVALVNIAARISPPTARSMRAWFETEQGTSIRAAMSSWATQTDTLNRFAETDENRKRYFESIGTEDLWLAEPFTQSAIMNMPGYTASYALDSTSFAQLIEQSVIPPQRVPYELRQVIVEQVLPSAFQSVDAVELEALLDFISQPETRQVVGLLLETIHTTEGSSARRVRKLLQQYVTTGNAPTAPSKEAPAASISVDEAIEILNAGQTARFPAAAASMRRLLKSQPDHVEALIALGRLTASQARVRFNPSGFVHSYDERLFAEARRRLERAVAIAPENPDAHVYLGWQLIGDGDLAAAEHHLNLAVELGSTNRWLEMNLGFLKFEQGNVPEAVALHSSALTKATDIAVIDNAIYALCAVEANPDNIDLIVEAMERYRAKGAMLPRQLTWYSQAVLRHAGDTEHAVAIAREMLNQQPPPLAKRHFAVAQLADVAARFSNADGFPDSEGTVLVEQALSVYPDLPGLIDELASFKSSVWGILTLARVGQNLNLGAGLSPLSTAAWHEDLELARQLLSAGISLSAGNRGMPPLSVAVRMQHAEMVKLFLDAGADPTSAKQGLSQLHGNHSEQAERVRTLIEQARD